MSTRSATIQTAILVASGAAVAVAGVWGSRLLERARSTSHRRRQTVPVLRRQDGQILGADEALRRWEPGSR